MPRMFKLGMGVVLLAGLGSVAAADNFHAVVSSNGTFATFDVVDGCIETTGVFFSSTSDQGPIAAVIGISTDSCTTGPDGGPLTGAQLGYSNVALTSSGLGSATVAGSVTTDSWNSHFAPLTFDFSLAFAGTGNAFVEQNHGHYVSAGGNVVLSFSTSRRRNANVTGTITVDGSPITLSGAFLGAGISGDLSIAH
jgi:hypothetical protein